jgi:hypothetical protein
MIEKIEVKVKELIDADWFLLMDSEKHWFCNIQFNGEYTDEQQKLFISKMIKGLKE